MPRVTRVSFEGEAEDSDLLVVDGVEHSIDHKLSDAMLLVVVHLDHLMPVVGNLLARSSSGISICTFVPVKQVN